MNYFRFGESAPRERDKIHGRPDKNASVKQSPRICFSLLFLWTIDAYISVAWIRWGVIQSQRDWIRFSSKDVPRLLCSGIVVLPQLVAHKQCCCRHRKFYFARSNCAELSHAMHSHIQPSRQQCVRWKNIYECEHKTCQKCIYIPWDACTHVCSMFPSLREKRTKIWFIAFQQISPERPFLPATPNHSTSRSLAMHHRIDGRVMNKIESSPGIEKTWERN